MIPERGNALNYSSLLMHQQGLVFLIRKVYPSNMVSKKTRIYPFDWLESKSVVWNEGEGEKRPSTQGFNQRMNRTSAEHVLNVSCFYLFQLIFITIL